MDPSPGRSSDRDKSAESVKKIFDEIKEAAGNKDFQRAEALRERLLEQSPSALSEIIKSAEIIEEEKAAGIDPEHLAIWDELYSMLTQEEKNGLFYALKRVVVPPKKIILSHGAYNTRLFFIDSGKVTIIFPRKGKNTVLAQLGKGSLLGEYSFTSISLCSATAVSHTEVGLYYLENSATDDWPEKLPGLYDKIIDYCLKHGSLEEISRWKSLEKRNRPRHAVSGPVKGRLLNREGRKTETSLRGQLSDISLEGCAFEIKLSKKEIARALLGRHLLLNFSFEVDGETFVFERIGKVVKVSFYMHNDYCMHVQFNKAIKKATLEKILSTTE